MFGEISSALSVGERLWKWLTQWRKISTPITESVAARFVRVFESHGVHRNQIPRFFGHGLTLVDVHTDEALLPKLTEEMLDAACDKFAVHREWLDGADGQVHPTHDFYKSPEEFATFLDRLKQANPEIRISGRLLIPGKPDWGDNALLILEEPVGEIGDKGISRFHLCDNWHWTYWKARAYLAACISLAWQRQVHIGGVVVSKSVIARYQEGHELLGWDGEGVYAVRGARAYPADMIDNPDVFLDQVDPEQDMYGHQAGLELWLSLAEKGLIRTDFQSEQDIEVFRSRLDALRHV